MKTIIIALSACLMLAACDKASDSSLLGSIVKEKTASDVAKEVADSVIAFDFDKAISLATTKPIDAKGSRDAIPVFEWLKEQKANEERQGKVFTTMTDGKPYTLSIEEEETTLSTKIIKGVKQPDITRIIVKADIGNGQGRFFKMRLANVDGQWRVYDFN